MDKHVFVMCCNCLGLFLYQLQLSLLANNKRSWRLNAVFDLQFTKFSYITGEQQITFEGL